jgi:hypothetical protein
MLDMTQGLDAALKQVEQRLPTDFPVKLANSIFQGVRRHIKLFNLGLAHAGKATKSNSNTSEKKL